MCIYVVPRSYEMYEMYENSHSCQEKHDDTQSWYQTHDPARVND